MLRFTLIIAALCMLASAHAADVTYKDVSIDDLKTAIKNKAVTIIDVNGSTSYKKHHIPGALDYTQVKDDLAKHLPKDKSALIVAYCGGPKCGAYKMVADAAVKLGYTNVAHLSAGISGWLKDQNGAHSQAKSAYKDISIADLKKAIKDGSVTLIDVNGSKSYAQGHIPTAKDFSAIKSDLAKHLPENKDSLIVAYCGSPKCGAYKRAAAAATKLGYTNVAHLSAGISGWKDAGEQVE